MGRHRKPIEEIKKAGDYRPNRHVETLRDTQDSGIPERCSNWEFDEHAEYFWSLVIEQCSSYLCPQDAPALYAACKLWSAINRGRPSDRGYSTLVTNWAMFAARFGLTPGDRGKIQSDKVKKDPSGLQRILSMNEMRPN